MTALLLRSRWLPRPTVALVLVATVWGLTYPLTGTLLTHLTVSILLALRFGLALVLLLPSMLRARWSQSLVLAGVTLGVVQALEFGALTAGLALTPPGRAAFLVSLSVVLVNGLDASRARRLPRKTVMCTLLLLTGLGLLTRPGTPWPFTFQLGDALCLACALFTALQVVLTGRLVQRQGPDVSPALLVGLQAATVAVLYGAASLLIQGQRSLNWLALPGPLLLGLLCGVLLLALLATVFALVAQTWAQGQVSASRVAMIYALEPLVAALVSGLWLGEHFTLLQVVGGALMLAAQFGGQRGEA